MSFKLFYTEAFCSFPSFPVLGSPALLNHNPCCGWLSVDLECVHSHVFSETRRLCVLGYFFLQILDLSHKILASRMTVNKHGVWIVVNSIKMNLSKHLLCGFLYQRMQDVEEMTLRFSHFYSFMWLVMDFSNVALTHPTQATFRQQGAKSCRNKHTAFCWSYIHNNPWVCVFL